MSTRSILIILSLTLFSLGLTAKPISHNKLRLVEEKDLTTFPVSLFGVLESYHEVDGRTKKELCTVTMISPRHALTAAHCTKNLEMAKTAFVAIGVNVTYTNNKTKRVVFKGYDFDIEKVIKSKTDDLAVLVLTGENNGFQESNFIRLGHPSNMELNEIAVYGFPIDRLDISPRISTCKAYPEFFNKNKLTHECSTDVGMSGGPLIANTSEGLTIVGIHSHANLAESNSAVRLLETQVVFINTAVAENP